jgi:hypothetical protein
MLADAGMERNASLGRPATRRGVRAWHRQLGRRVVGRVTP